MTTLSIVVKISNGKKPRRGIAGVPASPRRER